MFRSRRKTARHAKISFDEEPSSIIRLTGMTRKVRRVIFLPRQKLILAASWDGNVQAYDIDTKGNPCATFRQHSAPVHDMVQLDGDIVASVGEDGSLFSWRASSSESIPVVGEWKHGCALCSIAKLDYSKILVGDIVGTISVLRHVTGTEFNEQYRLSRTHADLIWHISVHRNIFVSCSQDRTAIIWDTETFDVLDTQRYAKPLNCAAINDSCIVTACNDGYVYVYRNENDFPLIFKVRVDFGKVKYVTIINDNLVAAAGYFGNITFISLSSQGVLLRYSMERWVNAFVLLSEGCIAVGGGYVLDDDEYCAIVSLPNSQSVRRPIEEHAAALHKSSTPPLRTAWVAVQDCQITLADACKKVITSENCAASVDEWCVAHDLLMAAVRHGQVPRRPDFDGNIAHWHSELYQYCGKFVLNQDCHNLVKSMFKQAEDAGVIEKGGINLFISTNAIRQDMEKERTFTANAIYQLFLRQAETDVRLREIFHYQKVQQMTALVNAIVGLCIPVGGSLVTNAISGGAAIMNDFQVCGLMGSLLGIAQDASGGFGSARLVDCFLRSSKKVLSCEEWSCLSEERRKVVVDAASNLGLTIDDLRVKLSQVEKMRRGNENDVSQLHSVDEVEENIDEVKKIEATNPSAGSPFDSLATERNGMNDVGTSGIEAAESKHATEIADELKWWKKKGVSEQTVGSLQSHDLAACFSAFLVNYEPALDGTFSRLKEKTVDVFRRGLIFGETFAEADDEVQKFLQDMLVKAVRNVTEEDVIWVLFK